MFLPKTYRDRMLDHVGGNNLIQEGWQAADLHVHSSCSNDVLPAPEFHPEAIYQKAKKKGFRYITITDHDTMKAYDIIGWERERLITGVEISFNDPIRVGHTLHINVYQLDQSQFNELKRIAQTDRNIETFIAYLQDQNLPYVYNHPFWFAAKDKPNYRAPEDIIELFPVVEYNMKRVRKKNMLALWLASKYNKGIMAATDTHIGNIGAAYTLSKGDTFQEYFNNIVEGHSMIVPQDLTLKNLNNEIACWIDILFSLDDSTWEKTRITGIRLVDGGINFLANNTSQDYPRIFPVLESFSLKLAKTGICSYLYLRSQNRMAHKIEKLLQNPNLA